MTDWNAIAERLLAAWEAGEDAPPELAASLDMADAYRVQMAVLERRRAEGHAQSGWKIGGTLHAMRAGRGETTPALGFLLAGNGRESGDRVHLGGAGDWFLEPELAFVMGSGLHGPGVTPEQVRTAVGAVAPAMELVRQPETFRALAPRRALNLTTAGYVLGPAVPGCPDRTALDDLRASALCGSAAGDGEAVAHARLGDVGDNPLDSVAWLVETLAGLGQGVEAGQVVLTGSLSPLLPLRPGEHWRVELDGVGAVELNVG